MVSLVSVCDACGRLYQFDDESLSNCGWCGNDICISCEPEHDCINEKENEEEDNEED